MARVKCVMGVAHKKIMILNKKPGYSNPGLFAILIFMGISADKISNRELSAPFWITAVLDHWGHFSFAASYRI